MIIFFKEITTKINNKIIFSRKLWIKMTSYRNLFKINRELLKT